MSGSLLRCEWTTVSVFADLAKLSRDTQTPLFPKDPPNNPVDTTQLSAFDKTPPRAKQKSATPTSPLSQINS